MSKEQSEKVGPSGTSTPSPPPTSPPASTPAPAQANASSLPAITFTAINGPGQQYGLPQAQVLAPAVANNHQGQMTVAPSGPPLSSNNQQAPSPAAPSAITTFTIPPSGRTDSQILAGGLPELDALSVLQLAGTHTNKEFIAAWNEQHPRQSVQLKDQTLSRRITAAIRLVEKDSGIPEKTVRDELDRVKESNGTTARKNATTGRARWSTPAKEAKARQDSVLMAVSNAGGRLKHPEWMQEANSDPEAVAEGQQPEGEVDDNQPTYSGGAGEDSGDGGDGEDGEDGADGEDGENGENSEEESELTEEEYRAAAREEALELIRTGGLQAMTGEQLLVVAASFTNHEMVERFNAQHGAGTLTDVSLSKRLRKAYDSIEGRTKEEVKAQVEDYRLRLGTTARKNAFAAERAAEAIAAKKKDAEEARRAQAEAEEEPDSDEDPIADLEEAVERDDIEVSHSPPPPLLDDDDEAPVPAPFSIAPTGHLAAHPGFHTFNSLAPVQQTQPTPYDIGAATATTGTGTDQQQPQVTTNLAQFRHWVNTDDGRPRYHVDNWHYTSEHYTPAMHAAAARGRGRGGGRGRGRGG
ncbi:hypothetical protein LTR09_007466 [Extremus antarcticus]|uniref:Uncharacterized protein n=1 Tax=Extremus antarcticus TaxID=702011 RepID=A0AAJ0DCY0_9PEZI|nr:hypothetical protein LTR09_007466 [Extremus antarcticus]